MNGLHLIGDLTNCRCNPDRLLDSSMFQEKCVELVNDSGLTIMDVSFHQFINSGFTGTVVLAESHLAIHTWPERLGLTLDVYVCNYSGDNSKKAEILFNSVVKYFSPAEIAMTSIDRGEHLLLEPLNSSTGFYIKALKQLGTWQTDYQKLSIYETAHYGKIFRLDDFNMTSEKDEFIYHEALVHPALLMQNAPSNALIIGGGDGGSAEEILKHPSIKEVILCEIDKDVITMAKQYFNVVHHNVFDNPKLMVIITDGILFLKETKKKFDLITLDLNDPVGPAEALYSEEFFKSCSKALNAGGVMSCHVGPILSQTERTVAIINSLMNTFTYVRPYIMYIPLYGTLWMMTTCSNMLDPENFSRFEIDHRLNKREITDLRYYSGAVHEAILTLPTFIKDMIG